MKRKRLVFLAALLLFAALSGCAKNRPDATVKLTDASEAAELTDVAGHPAETYILEGLRRGLYYAPSDGLFRPEQPVTREEFIVSLWNLAGQPEADVRKTPSGWNDALRQALAWADATGCLDSAASVGTFDPDELMTRQAAMESFFSYNGSVPGMEAMLTGWYDDAFVDSAEIPPEGKPALYWGFYNVLIRETEPDRIDPSGTVSRGDMAEMMVRYLRDFADGPSQD